MTAKNALFGLTIAILLLWFWAFSYRTGASNVTWADFLETQECTVLYEYPNIIRWACQDGYTYWRESL